MKKKKKTQQSLTNPPKLWPFFPFLWLVNEERNNFFKKKKIEKERWKELVPLHRKFNWVEVRVSMGQTSKACMNKWWWHVFLNRVWWGWDSHPYDLVHCTVIECGQRRRRRRSSGWDHPGGTHNKLVAYRFPKKQGLRGDLWALYSVKIRMLCDPESLTHIAITLSALLGPKPHI